jgi:hypothetical protein
LAVSDRYGRLYQAAGDGLRDHLDETSIDAAEASSSTA